MTSRKSPILIFAGLSLLSAALLAASGCGKKEEPPPPPPPPPPVARAPDPVRVDELITDPRVQFPQKFVPVDESLARAVVNFASDLAAGDREGFEAALDAPARSTLDLLVESGQWTGATASIQVVRVVRLDASGSTADVGLAIQDAQGAYLTGWRAQQSRDRWVFGAMPSPPRSALTAAELDGAALIAQVAEQPKDASKAPAKPAEEAKPAPSGESTGFIN